MYKLPDGYRVIKNYLSSNRVFYTLERQRKFWIFTAWDEVVSHSWGGCSRLTFDSLKEIEEYFERKKILDQIPNVMREWDSER
jgi:IS1 family transposase